MSRGEFIDIDTLPRSFRLPSDSTQGDLHLQRELSRWIEERLNQLDAETLDATLYEETLAAIEPTLLKMVWQHCSGNRAATARLLGLHRATLRQKLRRYDIDLSDEE